MSSSPQRVRFRLRLRKPHTRASVSILSRCCLGCLFHAGRRAHLDPAVTVRAYATAIAQLEAFLIGRSADHDGRSAGWISSARVFDWLVAEGEVAGLADDHYPATSSPTPPPAGADRRGDRRAAGGLRWT